MTSRPIALRWSICVGARAFEAAIYPHYPRMQYELSAAWDVEMVKTEHLAVLLGKD